jgi:hypothetical protein
LYRGKYVKIDTFSGGYCGALDPSTLDLNQASDLDNIVLEEQGQGFRTRPATVSLNSTEFGSANSYPVIGVGFLRTAAGLQYVLAIKNGKAYAASYSGIRNSSTFSDVTGAISISTQASASLEAAVQRWRFCSHNSVLIGFGGDQTGTFDAPIKYTGSGNIAALGGSPPSAMLCLSANNRVFAARTAANPSTLYWSVLGNPEDWTGAGSGSAVIGTLNDNDPIMEIAVLSSNRMLVFKRTKIYQVDLTQAPFSSTLLFDGVGAFGTGSVVVVDGVAYFLSANLEMQATDGGSVMRMSGSANNLFAQAFFFNGLHGFRVRNNTNAFAVTTHPGSDWIAWCPYSSPTPGYAVVWDLKNKCWLKCTTGFQFASGDYDSSGNLIGGWGNKGVLYLPLYGANNQTDDTNDSAGVITGNWKSGWLSLTNEDQVLQVNRLLVHLFVVFGGTVTLAWRFDFKPTDSGTASLSTTADSNELEVIRRTMVTGRGNAFRFELTLTPPTTAPLRLRGITLGGKIGGQKVRSAP